MPISKTDFDLALNLESDAQAAANESDAKRDEAQARRQDLKVLIAGWSILDGADPVAVELVEHEGTVYRVTARGLRALVTETTV
jgi:hypothetical protein